MSSTRLVWGLAGHPSPVATVAALLNQPSGTCRMCGGTDLPTADAGKALGANWTDHSCWQVPRSDRVCSACLWCCSGKPPATLRMWTVLAAPGVDVGSSHEKCAVPSGPGLAFVNRAATRPVIDLLAHPPAGPWVCSVAISGQKHVLPYAPVNTGAGRWTVRMESTNVTATPDLWRGVHEHASVLRRMGIGADDVLTGRPGVGIKTRDDLDAWRDHADALRPYRCSPLLELALWTITKGTLA